MCQTTQRRRIAVMRIPLHALAGLGLAPGDPGYEAAFNATLPQNVQAQNQASMNAQANARYQVNYAIYQTALSNWNLNQQQRQGLGLPPLPMPLPPNPADYINPDQGVGNAYLSPRGADTVQVTSYDPGPVAPAAPGVVPFFTIYDPEHTTPGSPLAQANAAQVFADQHAANLAQQQAAAAKDAQVQADANARYQAAQQQAANDRAKAATALQQDQANAAAAQKAFVAWSNQQTAARNAAAIAAQNAQNAQNATLTPVISQWPAGVTHGDPPPASTGTTPPTTATSWEEFFKNLTTGSASSTDPGTVIGNGSTLGPLGPLSAPAASYLPQSIQSTLPSWLTSIPVWGAVAGIVGVGFVVYDHTGRKTRR